MKKIFLILGISLLTQSLFAQTIKYGIQAGINAPSLQPHTNFHPGAQDNSAISLQIGAVADINYGKFSIQPGLSLSGKGNKSTAQQNLISYGSSIPYEIEQNVNIWYAELPVNALYHIPVKIGKVFIGGGPYAAYALSGSVRNKTKRNIYVKRTQKEDIEFGNEEMETKAGDFGLNLLAGVQLKNGFNAGLNYGFGLNNLSNTSLKSYNRVASIKVGYFF